MSLRATRAGLLLVTVCAAPLFPQSSKTPFEPIPANQRMRLNKRLAEYTAAFRDKNWNALYYLASDRNKMSASPYWMRVLTEK